MKKLLLIALLVLGATSTVLAASMNDISLGEPGYGGTGCPSGSASATLSPDKKSLSLIFDEFLAEAGGSAGRRVSRKTCNIAIPVHVPQGFSVAVIDVDYRGFVYLPSRKARARFTAEYFFAGSRGPRYTRNWRGPHDDEYVIDNTLVGYALVWSECGADVNLRVNTSMMVRNTSRREEAMATVDSADFNAGLIYKFQWKSCYESQPEDDWGDDADDDDWF
ncbi:MAG: DUF4360 domain-containing protein [Bacteriovoracaceae bacterium]|nr:DUF4360 domain-containing protein [Bacteriovoracaceae bacterium]